MKKLKLLLQKPFFKTAGQFIRPFVKNIPIIGNPLVEGITTILTPTGQSKKHSTISQIIQWVIVGLVAVDLIVNKGENIKVLFDFFLSFSSEVPEVSPAQ